MTRGALGWALVVLQFVLLGLLVLVPRTEATPLRLALATVPLVAAIVLGLWAGARLGSALTPTPVPVTGATLRTDGPYARLRHPIYTAVLLGGLSFTVAFGSWWTLLVLFTLLAFFALKARWEDALLHEAHGTEWEEWSRRTGALVPQVRGGIRRDR